MKLSFDCDVDTLYMLDEIIKHLFVKYNIKSTRSEAIRSCIRHYYDTEK